MTTAYVFMNCDIGSEKAVTKLLKGLEGVKEVHRVFGVYDIIAKVETDITEKLHEIITLKIRKIEKIRSTLTLMETKGQD